LLCGITGWWGASCARGCCLDGIDGCDGSGTCLCLAHRSVCRSLGSRQNSRRRGGSVQPLPAHQARTAAVLRVLENRDAVMGGALCCIFPEPHRNGRARALPTL
jgi:hypothetical protein